MATIIVFLMWMHRAHRNLPALGATSLKYSPGWAVGGWFVPILNLFRPYQVMKEICQGSDPDAYREGVFDRRVAGTANVGFWWAAWIINDFIGKSTFRLSWKAETIDEFLMASQVAIANGVVSIIAAVLVIFIVRSISSNQEERASAIYMDQIAVEAESDPAP